MECIIYKLMEGVHHGDTIIRHDTIKFSERDLPFQRFTRDMIEQITYIAHAKQPTICRCSIPVEDGVSPCFDGPIAPFREILILMIRLLLYILRISLTLLEIST